MANNNSNPNNTAFSGFPGGHDSVPGVGNVTSATTGFANTSTSTLGANLPSVNPNTFQGTVHWGPEQVIAGSQAGQLPAGGAATGTGIGHN